MERLKLIKSKENKFHWGAMIDVFLELNVPEAEIILPRKLMSLAYSGLRNNIRYRDLDIYVKRDQTSKLLVNRIIMIRKDVKNGI